MALDRCGAMVTEPDVKPGKPEMLRCATAGRSPMPQTMRSGPAAATMSAR